MTTPATPAAPVAAPVETAPPAATAAAPATPPAAVSTPPAGVAPTADAKATPAPAETALTPAAPAPAGIELKLPDGFQADAGVEKFKSIAKEAGLDSKHAQKVFDLYAEAEAAKAEEQAAQRKGWAESLKADKEFGGAGYEANRMLARQAVTKFASPALQKLLAETGYGNHPEFVRAFVKIGKALGEDSIAGRGTTNGAPAEPKSQDAILRQRFPTMFQTKE